MFVRIVRVKRKGQVREYAQLVESYRRESDGRPAHRVIAPLGEPNDPLVANVRQALAAARQGKRVAAVLPQRLKKPPKPQANLRFLDVAVLLELWREWELDRICDELLPQGQGSLRPADIVAALVLQRCVDPGSKLFATRWLPQTALVELLGIAPSQFNNTRLHRVLEDLDNATTRLMAKLPQHYETQAGAFTALFLDVTDTWFVGDGCESATYAKTKEGFTRRKVGIVLLCNEHGYPLRWEVIQGSRADGKAMTSMMNAIAGSSWAAEAPLVCDRAMGHTKTLTAMAATGLRFLTALNANEFDSYVPDLVPSELAKMEIDDADLDDAAKNELCEQASRIVQDAGFAKVDEDLFVADFGTIEHAGSVTRRSANADPETDITIAAMRYCRQLEEMVARNEVTKYRAAARKLGLSRSLADKYRQLRRLSEQQQRDVLEGRVCGHTLAALLAVAAIHDRDEQQEAFDDLARSTPREPSPTRSSPQREEPDTNAPLRVRVAAYFNPERFVRQRVHARERLQAIQSFAQELNESLASPQSKHTVKSIAAKIDRRLHKEGLLGVYDVEIAEQKIGNRVRRSVTLQLKSAEWTRRRRFDGFSVLVAHPDLQQDATQLCRLYRSKDAVEKDFQVIKSVVELRPVRHQTDAKVRAHVTLCMLALLLERTLTKKLARTKWSAPGALQVLQPCHLNQFDVAGDTPAYVITETNADQDTILRALRLQHLTDDDALAARISPR